MGRSRAVSHVADDDHNQNRSKRKRTISSFENIETASTGQPLSGGKVALYHCNYCKKDLSGMVRIKCAVCSNFDLCIECFSVGAEIHLHKSNHPYRVMGIEMYGFGIWGEVAEQVETKSKSQCIEHYSAIYMNSTRFPLLDLSLLKGKSKEELLAMAKEHLEVKKDERKRRKDCILERNLLYPDPFERNLSPEEREIHQRYKVFMRFHSKENLEELLKSVMEEQRIVKRVQELQEAQASGCRTSTEAHRFLEHKRKEVEENAQRVKESGQAGPSGKLLQRPNSLKGEVEVSPRGVARISTGLQPYGDDSSSTIASSLDDWDITGLMSANLLSETEKRARLRYYRHIISRCWRPYR